MICGNKTDEYKRAALQKLEAAAAAERAREASDGDERDEDNDGDIEFSDDDLPLDSPLKRHNSSDLSRKSSSGRMPRQNSSGTRRLRVGVMGS